MAGSGLAIFASPTFKATYTGLLKLFLEKFDGGTGLAGVTVVRELDDAGWAKVLDAGPGLIALELRQLGGAFAAPATDGGALDRFAAPLIYYAVGVAGDDTGRELAAVRSAFEPYLTGRTAPNYINHGDQPQRTYSDETRTRVERVRHGADPTGLFAGDVAPIRDRA